uniref:Ovule protein n=1 Tax=Mesocestoides corti TaxID=53468 RepID=A0A5K3F548_MESCO
MTTRTGNQKTLPLFFIGWKWLEFDPRYPNTSAAANVVYPSPCLKRTATTEEALLINQKPEPQIRSRPSESHTLLTSFIVYHFSNVSVSCWLHIFFARHLNANRQRTS